DGAAMDLSTLGGDDSAGFAINDASQVTGSSTTAEGESHAFLYADGVMQDLGTLGGDYSIGYAVNDGGWVTGVASTADDEFLPFVYGDGEMVLLDVRELGGTEGVGHAINGAGQVAGWYRAYGVFEPETRAFLATPISLLFSRLQDKATGLGPGRSLVDKVQAAESHFRAADSYGSCAALRAAKHLTRLTGMRRGGYGYGKYVNETEAD